MQSKWGLNDHLIPNCEGKEVKFAVQPYNSGKGTITKITARRIKGEQFCMGKGAMLVEYEAFDVEILVSEGSETGAFYCGVPCSAPRDLAGKTQTLIGISYDKLVSAVNKGHPIIIARCG